MVTGNGLIAKRFDSYSGNDRFLIFASGVSNSKSTIQSEYEREFNLLKQKIEENRDKVFVYFSTCSINDPYENASDYVKHKQNIERYIASNVEHYLIFRVSNLVGKTTNANTIFNFIFNNISQGIQFNLWVNAKRNLIDIDDFYVISDYILTNGLLPNQIVNVANPENYAVLNIVEAIEKHLDKEARYAPVAKGGEFHIDIADISTIIKQLSINFDDGYLERLLIKYH